MKKTLLRAALGAALLGTGPLAIAQNVPRWCATDEHNAEPERTFHDPQLAAERAAAEKLAERLQNDDVFARQFRVQNRTAASRIVPVVVHVVTECGQQTLSEAQIQAGLNQLNADWAFTNSDAPTTHPQFLPYAANMDVEFRMAKLDPQGNPFTGIHRVSSVATDNVEPRDNIKSIRAVLGRVSQYLNREWHRGGRRLASRRYHSGVRPIPWHRSVEHLGDGNALGRLVFAPPSATAAPQRTNSGTASTCTTRSREAAARAARPAAIWCAIPLQLPAPATAAI